MKNRKNHWRSTIVAMVLLVFSAACNSNKGEVAQEEKDGMEMAGEVDGRQQNEGMEQHRDENSEMRALLSDYMELKIALFNDEFEKAEVIASDMLISLGQMENEGMPDQLEPYIRKLAEAREIDTQRQHFATLSRQLYSIVKNKNVTSKPLYWMQCPMAMGGEGARWLSDEEQVRNPFMGQKMPECGSVAETIN